MSDLDPSALAGMRDCWITGGQAWNFAPADWQALADAAAADERERLLLAIAGQALDVAMRPAAPKVLTRRSPLPQLALPTLPDRLRPVFRTALKQAADAKRKIRIAALVASRGFVAHPMDWMPAATDQDCPAVYAPWVDWRANAGHAKGAERDRLTAETWDDFYPAARRAALTAMRAAEPAAARALIEAKASGEAAEARLQLVEVMRIGLSAEDVPFLESLSGDRSGKVRELAARLLARLGERGHAAGAEAEGPAAELAEFIRQGRSGLIRRRTVYSPAKLKSAAQERRRAELFEMCSLVDVTARFGTADQDFLDGWQYGLEADVDLLLARMVAVSGSDASVGRMADALLSQASGAAKLLIALSPRLDDKRMRGLARLLLSGEHHQITLLDAVDSVEPGWIERDELLRSRSFKVLLAAIAGSNESVRRTAAGELDTLAFLATAEAAEAIIGEVVAAGLPPADSALGFLRLNAALGTRQSNSI